MLSRKLTSIVISAIGLTISAGRSARANLVTNGGFDFYTGTAPKGYFNTVLPTDWSGYFFDTIDAPGTADALPDIPVYPGFPATSPQGGNFVQADSTPGLSGPITQMINGLSIGQSYNLSFYQAAGQELNGTGATTDQWEVSLGSQTQYSTLMSIPQGGMYPWITQSMTFNATSTSELLSFIAIGTGGDPPQIFLDGVDLESTVPEPSALMLLTGVAGVCVMGRAGRRLRARQSTVAA